jgi:hypothetical protein
MSLTFAAVHATCLGDQPQNALPGTTIALKDSDSPAVSVVIIDKVRAAELSDQTVPRITLPKVILNLDGPQAVSSASIDIPQERKSAAPPPVTIHPKARPAAQADLAAVRQEERKSANAPEERKSAKPPVATIKLEANPKAETAAQADLTVKAQEQRKTSEPPVAPAKPKVKLTVESESLARAQDQHKTTESLGQSGKPETQLAPVPDLSADRIANATAKPAPAAREAKPRARVKIAANPPSQNVATAAVPQAPVVAAAPLVSPPLSPQDAPAPAPQTAQPIAQAPAPQTPALPSSPANAQPVPAPAPAQPIAQAPVPQTPAAAPSLPISQQLGPVPAPLAGQPLAQVPLAQMPSRPEWLPENQQVGPGPLPQMAMAVPLHPVSAGDSDERNPNVAKGEQTPAPSQEPQQAPSPQNGAPATASNQTDQKIGEAPPDTSLQFLREQTVLLKPCEWQMDVGLSYLIFDNQFTDVTPDGHLVQDRLRRRLLLMPLEIRYGLYERVQLFANAPFGWANTEISRVGIAQFDNNGGIGDTNAGATFLIRKSNGCSYSPDVLATFGVTAPTGNGNALVNLLVSPSLTLGQGFWAGFWNVLLIHKYDPVVVFYGVGSRHYVERDVAGFTGTKPGDQYIYQFGTGFALNERITLSTMFFGSYITDARLNDQVLDGTILEPMYVRFATTITRPNKRIFEPFVEIGLTDDSANARVGMTWTF